MLFYKPEWVRSGMRAGTRAIEAAGDALPSYWGAQAEIILRELGGFLWIQKPIVGVSTILWLKCRYRTATVFRANESFPVCPCSPKKQAEGFLMSSSTITISRTWRG
jgi:hypothetical protein